MKKIFILLTFLVSCSTFAFAQIYKIGDYYNDGKKEGVVFEVSEDGRHGKIVSMKQSAKELQWSSDATAQKYYTGADSYKDGLYNMNKIKSISGWEKKYPAFKWCADLGAGWYLPTQNELGVIYVNKDKINQILMANRMDLLGAKGSYRGLWSSCECNSYSAAATLFSSGNTYCYSKYEKLAVRAVLVLD